jgi:hypothetical protein
VSIVLLILPVEQLVETITDVDFADKLLQQIARTVSDLLNKAAPFLFTMLMGLMGSAVIVSRQFVSDFEERPAIWYLYRML